MCPTPTATTSSTAPRASSTCRIPIPERLELVRARPRVHGARWWRRPAAHPGDDMLGMLVREHGDELTDDELIGIAGLLLLAGHETTSNMLGLGTLALLRHPDQLAAVRDDPDAVGPAVEELLRWLSIVQSAIPRITTTDVEVAGVRDPGRRAGVRVAAVGQPGPGRSSTTPDVLDIRRGAPGPSGVRPRCAPLPWRAAGPHGDARSRFPRCCAASRRWRSPRTSTMSQFRSFHFIYGLRSLAVTW